MRKVFNQTSVTCPKTGAPALTYLMFLYFLIYFYLAVITIYKYTIQCVPLHYLSLMVAPWGKTYELYCSQPYSQCLEQLSEKTRKSVNICYQIQ